MKYNPQYKDDARRYLYTLQGKLASTRKTIRDNPNPNSVAIAEATLPSVLRSVQEMEIKLATLPDRPKEDDMRSYRRIGPTERLYPESSQPSLDGSHWPDLPDFLKRNKDGTFQYPNGAADDIGDLL